MEYCATIWDPHHQGDIKKLEMVQHRGAHFVLTGLGLTTEMRV